MNVNVAAGSPCVPQPERPPGGLTHRPTAHTPPPPPGTDKAVRSCWLPITHHLGELSTDRQGAAVGESGWALP